MAQEKASPKPRSTRSLGRKKVEPVVAASNINPQVPFPVVAIGASAAGLADATALLERLPAKSGMAFVVIQHPQPKHEGTQATLLSNATAMQVVEVPDRSAIEPNHVYVIPPNKKMTIREGVLRLAPRLERRSLQHPIDDFCLALAQEQGSAAIGVVLSGTGSDGTQGLQAIHAAGGVTFVQDPKSAQRPARPISAIDSASVHFILPPARIATELARLGIKPHVAEVRDGAEGSDLNKVCRAVRAASGVDFHLFKQPTVRRRIARRMAMHKVPSLSEYAQILKQNPQEAQSLADDIFIPVTSFFRDPESFQSLRKRVLAKLRSAKVLNADALRIWVPGCSTGEEAYSIAILLLEGLGEQAAGFKIQIFATDIQEQAVERARAGVYRAGAVAGLSPARLKRFFVEENHGYRIQKFVRDLCVFARHDLAKDPPFSRLDLISCRNVLIYMGPVLQKRLISIFQHALKPDGLLFLGSAESVGDSLHTFTVEDRKHRIFLRKPAPSSAPVLQTPGEEFCPVPAASGRDFRREAERILLEHYAPAAVIVDSDLQITHFQGETSQYLAPAAGQPGSHVLTMIRPELAVDLRAAISKARKEQVPVHKEAIAFENEGHAAQVRLEVLPLKAPAAKRGDLLVVFQKKELQSAHSSFKKAGPAALRKFAAEKTNRLELDLASVRRHLQALISEHETAQEEMNAANEEILSSNEELQSINEELETAKEELQSSNEELITLNAELLHRNHDLNILMGDLSDLLVGINIAVLVLDADLRVRRFTPVAGTLLNLAPADVGRPFSDIASALAVIDWQGLLFELRQKKRPLEREVTDRDGRRYSLHLRPYKTAGNDIEGALVVLFDVELNKRALEEAQTLRDLAVEAENLNAAILDALLANVAVLNAEGMTVAANEARKDFPDKNSVLSLLGPGVEANDLRSSQQAAAAGDSNAKNAVAGLRGVLKSPQNAFDFEYPYHSADKQRWFLMNVSPVKGREGGAVVTETNITHLKPVEMALRTGEFTIRPLLASSPQSVVAVGSDGKIAFVNGNVQAMFGYGREELIGQPLELLMPEMSRGRAGHDRSHFAGLQSRAKGMGLDLTALRKDGTSFPVEIGISAVETSQGKLAIAFVSDITERKKMEQAAEDHAKEVQALAASLLTAQEEERRRVSRELHDQICQQLASIAIDMGGLTSGQILSDDLQSRLKALQFRIAKASDETRHIAYQLHSSVLDDLGLIASLQDLGNDLSRQTKIGVKFTHDALPPTVPREVASCLYRVAQESFQNIIKHANAKHVMVALTVRKGIIALMVKDDGVGFNTQTAKGRGGFGLISMEERVRLIKGKLSVIAQPGRGTQVDLELPNPPL